MSKRSKGWYVADEGTRMCYRGPYKHSETAAAVRSEMELNCPNKNWNLWVINNEALDEWDSAATAVRRAKPAGA